MIIVDRAILSDDIAENFFVCNLEKCKGACCVEGDLGAPLEDEELETMEEIYDEVKPYMREEGIAAVEAQGKYVLDEDGDYSTTTVNGKECAYAIYDERGILKCAIEQAYNAGKIGFKKPISCHLYPIRITKYDKYDAVNYDRWSICSPACALGTQLNVPLYIFLKEALLRKYGQQWYNNLVEAIKNHDKKLNSKAS
ncbi:MAG: DUF3109 family protein [Cyclobacteriaceae bacterium]|nr:DUF3109 family protein [Cyclobacteriaceae bacterium]